MAKTKKQAPAEAKLDEQLKSIKARAKDRDYTDAEEKQIASLKKELGALRFVRLAVKRVPAAIAKIKNVAGLSGKAYSCTQAQADYIIGQLETAVKDLKQSFMGGTKVKSGFQLPE